MALYLSTLIRNTPPKIRRNATKVAITKIKAALDKDERGDHKYVTAQARTRGKNNKYVLAVRLYGKHRPDGAMRLNNTTWVACS